MIIRITALLLCIHKSHCSLVLDEMNQKDPYLSEYCPKTDYCEEGTHVMCMYYNPKQVMGPRCSNPQNISMTPDIANKLLEVSNAVRSRIALGKETGKDGPLPRGYGIFRLSWDEDLAMFAQVLANQCVLTRDLCRATKKFPVPGQATGLVRFTFPDWLPVSNKSYFITANLTPPKLNYAMTQTMKSWYNQKNHVTSEMVLNYPDFQNKLVSQLGKLYLKIIYGPATHMGCGISAYTQFAYYDNNSPLNYNVVQVVCNFSAQPGSGQPVYTTSPPTLVGYTIRCGCPEGYDEDADCLCFENRKSTGIVSSTPTPYCSDDSCKPSVVLLPIITVEDAPSRELLPSSFKNYSRRIGQSEMLKNYGEYMLNTQTFDPRNLNEFTELLKGSNIARSKSSVSERRFESRKVPNKHRYAKSNLPSLKHVPRKHAGKHNSIFSRATKFKLPARKVFNSYRDDNNVKKDVAPRKDFSRVQKLMKSYLNKKRNHAGNIFNGAHSEYTSNEPFTPKSNTHKGIERHVSEISLIKSKDTNPYRITNANLDLKLRYDDINTTMDKDVDITHINYNRDKQLMALLENLEKEVKHIELNSRDKEIVDSKIRKIYNTIVGKRDLDIPPIRVIAKDKRPEEINENLLNYENAADKEFINKALKIKASENNKLNLYDVGLVKRDQNSIRSSNNNYMNIYRDNKHDINTYNGLSYDRKKIYQEKLDDLRRKFQGVKSIRQGSVNSARHVLPVRSIKSDIRPSKSKPLDTFYIPDRARFIHGF